MRQVLAVLLRLFYRWVFDPLRADLFDGVVRTVCPTADAKALLHEAVNSCEVRG